MITTAQLDAFHRIGAKPGKEYGDPPAKKLSKLLRPTFIASPGKVLVWGDWSAIEGRGLPWLAADKRADEKLDIFRESDNDETKPDIYVRTAVQVVSDGPFFGATGEEAWAAYTDKSHPLHAAAKALRQGQGKVPELSLGFGGALGALQAMAVNYGVYFDDEQGKEVVARWRDANPWARRFWGRHDREGSYGLWGAVCSAIESPDTICPAGRVAYVFDKTYLGGSLFCALPSGRLLTYPDIKWRWDKVKDKKTGKEKEVFRLSCIKGYGRSGMWYGKFAENVTQAEMTGSILRRTLKRLDHDPSLAEFMPVVGHTHDEIVTEVDEANEDEARAVLKEIMEENDEWDAGLPLKAEIDSNWYYTKALD